MTTLEEEALNELHKEAYNDKIIISDLSIIADYHKVLIELLEKRIDSLKRDRQRYEYYDTAYNKALNDVKEMLK